MSNPRWQAFDMDKQYQKFGEGEPLNIFQLEVKQRVKGFDITAPILGVQTEPAEGQKSGTWYSIPVGVGQYLDGEGDLIEEVFGIIDLSTIQRIRKEA